MSSLRSQFPPSAAFILIKGNLEITDNHFDTKMKKTERVGFEPTIPVYPG